MTQDKDKSCLADCQQSLIDALAAIGHAFGQYNLQSTATDQERRAAIARLSDAWNDYAVPALAQATGSSMMPPAPRALTEEERRAAWSKIAEMEN